MIFIIAVWFLVMLETILQLAIVGLALYFPYVFAFLSASLIYFFVQPLQNLIPGHPGLSGLVIIGGFELIVYILMHMWQTKKAIIVLLCITVPSFFIMIKPFTSDSWQLALFLTVIHLAILGFETVLTMGLHNVRNFLDKDLKVSVFNAISYSIAAAMITYSVTWCYWDMYMESVGKSKLFTVIKIIIGIVAMVIAFIMPIRSTLKYKKKLH